jgi:SSS family solute:Na+ symporter
MYPVALVFLWVPAVLFGVWGALEIPGLEGKMSYRVFPLLMLAHVGPVLQGVALAGILAAVMSTLDAQLLTLSSMLSRDVLRRYRPGMDDRAEVRWGRAFLLVIAGLAFAIALARPASIFTIATFSFSGYVMLVPTLFLSLRWRRFTAAGAIASITVGSAVLMVAFVAGGPVWGLLPVAWGLMAAIIAGVGVSLVTVPAPADRTERVLGPVDAALR